MKKEQLEQNKGTIYHELGHLIGYLLSANKNESNLGEILEFNIGLKNNSVTPKENYYHLIHPVNDRERVRKNTKNIIKKISWIIEVILGCLTQSIYENAKFEDCFGIEPKKLGYHDFSNLSMVNNLSHFRFNKLFIENLKIALQGFIIDNNLIEKLDSIVNEIISDLIKTDDFQKTYKNEELLKLLEKISEIFDEELLLSYNNIIKNHSEIIKTIERN